MPLLKQLLSRLEPSANRRWFSILATIGTTGIARAISLILSLAQVPLAIHALGSEGFGLWMTLTSLTALASFADFGIGNGIQNRVAHATGTDSPEKTSKAYWNGLTLLCAVALILTAVFAVLVVSVDWADVFNVESDTLRPQTTPALMVCAVFFSFGLPFSSVQKLAFGLQKGWLVSVVFLANSLGTLFAIWICIYLSLSFLPFIAVVQLPMILSNFGMIIYLLSQEPWLRPSLNLMSLAEMKALLRLGAQFVLPQFGASILFSAPQVLISHALGPTALTPFNLCQRIFGMIQQIQALAVTPLWPAFTEAYTRLDFHWIKRAFLLSVVFSSLGVAVLSILCIVAGPKLFMTWAGTTTDIPTPDLVMSFALWTTLIGIGIPIGNFLNGISRLRGMMIYGTINLIVSLIAMIIIVPSLGAVGVVLALSACYATIVLPGIILDARYAFEEMKASTTCLKT